MGEAVQLGLHYQSVRHDRADCHTRHSFQVSQVRRPETFPDDGLASLGGDASLPLSFLPGHAVTLPNMGIQVAHPGTSVSTHWAAEGLLTGVHPDVHGQFLLGDESFAALRTDVLPAVIALVGLLAQVQPAPESVFLATGPTAPPLSPSVNSLMV